MLLDASDGLLGVLGLVCSHLAAACLGLALFGRSSGARRPAVRGAVSGVGPLEAAYGKCQRAALCKVAHEITPHYRQLIEASPFCVLATAGPEGVDCSPRGDAPGRLVRVADSTTLLLPDRRGNNRIDSLRNVVRDPRVGLLFLLPGCGTTLRLNGRAAVSVDPELCRGFGVEGKPPRSVLVLKVDLVYFQCARAIVRSRLWDPARHVDPKSLPSVGEILAERSSGEIDGAEYDSAWWERARRTLW